MRLHTLHTHRTGVAYRHTCCSWAALLVAVVTVGAVFAPLWLTYAINARLWSAQLREYTVRQRPRVQFAFGHRLVAEFEDATANAAAPNRTDKYNEQIDEANSAAVGLPPMVVSSSFPYLNRLTEQHQRSISIRHWHELADFGAVDDQHIHVQFSFAPPKPAHRLTHLSLVLEFRAQLAGAGADDADTQSSVHCDGGIPAALVLTRWPIGRHHRIAGNTVVNLAGALQFHQTAAVGCAPSLASWFGIATGGDDHRHSWSTTWQLVPANSTDALDYEPSRMLRRLRQTAVHMEFHADGDGDVVREVRTTGPPELGGLIALTVRVRVADAEVRYTMSIWQQMFAMWQQYVALLVVVWLAAGHLLSVAFRRRWVRSWATVPWDHSKAH